MLSINYVPKKIEKPAKLIGASSAWVGIESILADIIDTFSVKRGTALEFGVEYGYSTAALSNYFEHVIGVDTFKGDVHVEVRDDYKHIAEKWLKDFNNVKLVQ